MEKSRIRDKHPGIRNTGALSQNPEPTVKKQFHPKEGTSEGAEKVLSSSSIDLPHCLSYKHFLLPPVFFIE
jgi:hypothetical protein